MDRWLARFGYALRRHGPIGFIWLAGYNILYYVLRRNRRGPDLEVADAFDERYGTETRGIRDIASLDIVSSPAARYAVRYDPSGADWVRVRLEDLHIDQSDFAFVDFGSGKGRVLLVAAAFPFKEVIGIEFSRELHEIALQNIARFPPGAIRAGAVRSICGDAASVEMPRSDLVCYFYNPFGAPVMKAVAARLIAHHQRFGHRIIVIYLHPRHRECFENTGEFTALNETSEALILSTRAEPIPRPHRDSRPVESGQGLR
jgi:SAM-dependent methyltransferase